jgi:hypothetical protein
MGKSTFTRARLSNVRVIMAIMCVLMMELLCQAVMGHISVLKYLLSGARGRLCHVLSCQALNDVVS